MSEEESALRTFNIFNLMQAVSMVWAAKNTGALDPGHVGGIFQFFSFFLFICFRVISLIMEICFDTF